MKYELVLLTFLIGLLFCGFVAGYVLHDDLNSLFTGEVTAQMDLDYQNISNCAGKSLEESTSCLRKKIMPIYNYTIRPDTIKTYDDILNNGGDCFDYSNLYLKMANMIGYNATLGKIPGHAFTIVYDETGYCVLDQTNLIGCMKLDYKQSLDNTPSTKPELTMDGTLLNNDSGDSSFDRDKTRESLLGSEYKEKTNKWTIKK